MTNEEATKRAIAKEVNRITKYLNYTDEELRHEYETTRSMATQDNIRRELVDRSY